MEQSALRVADIPPPPQAAEALPVVRERGRPPGTVGTTGVVGLADGESFTALREKQMILIDQLINWMLANPGRPFTEASKILGFSATWLRTVASSDSFRQRLAEKQKDFDTQLMIPALADKLRGVAKLAVERLELAIETSGDPEFLLDASEMLLKTQGMIGAGPATPGTPAGPTFQVDNMTLVIAEERAKLLSAQAQPRQITLENQP